MLEKGLQKKEKELAVAPESTFLNFAVETDCLLQSLITMQIKYEEERNRRKVLAAKYMALQDQNES